MHVCIEVKNNCNQTETALIEFCKVEMEKASQEFTCVYIGGD